MKIFQSAILAVLLSFFLLGGGNADADTIYLKNGKSLQGLISKEAQDTVVLNVGDGTVTFHAMEIERIERSTPEETAAIKKDWAMARIQNEKTRAQDMAERQKASEKWEALVSEEIHQGAEKRDADANAKTVAVTFYKHDHVVVQAVLNGETPASLILDTGCPTVLLTAQMARKLGISLDNIHNAPEIMVLDGKHKVRQAVLKSVKLGDLEEKNVATEVLLEDNSAVKKDLKDGLLGMSFLKKYNVTLDQKKSVLIFTPRH